MKTGNLVQDMNCIDHFAGLMKDRMAEKAPYYGDEWRTVDPGELFERCYGSLCKGKYADVANFAMMINARLAANDARVKAEVNENES